MQLWNVTHRARGDARLTEHEASVRHFLDANLKRRRVETRKGLHDGAKETDGATRAHECQRRSGSSLVFAVDDGIEEKGNEIRKMICMKVGKEDVSDSMSIDPGLHEIDQCAGSEIQQENLIGLHKISGRSTGGMHVGAGA